MIEPRVTLACLCAIALLSTGGCATYPTADSYRAATAPYPGGSAVPTPLDARAAFRQTFCGLLDDLSTAACDALLWRLADEPQDVLAPAAAVNPGPPRHRAFVVTGALGDCRLPGLVPFDGAQATPGPPAAGDIEVGRIQVSGRSGTAHNARQIADALRAAGLGTDERIVLVGYSKGANDILQFLVDEPELARHVAAVVSVAGAIEGSPLADYAESLYATFLSHSFDSVCPAGDGKVMESLVPATRRQWLAAHPLPSHVRYFSLAAFTTREHLSRALRESWQLLARTSKFNDGQVLAAAAVIPGSALLGYANADHWDVAIGVEQALPHLASRPAPRSFPRATLLRALLVHVDRELAAGAAAVGGSR